MLASASLCAPAAHASLISIGLQEAGTNGGAVTTVATDNGIGGVSYAGAYGDFTLNQIQATGSPALVSPNTSTAARSTSAVPRAEPLPST